MSVVSRVRRDSGAAAVEFALVATVLFTLLFGTIQFGFTFWEYIQVAHSAREGVRWAALGAVDADAISKAEDASPGLDFSRAGASVDVLPGSTSDSVKVIVTYPRTKLVPIPGLDDEIISTAELRLE